VPAQAVGADRARWPACTRAHVQGCDVEEVREAERQRLQLMYGDVDVSSGGSECVGCAWRVCCARDAAHGAHALFEAGIWCALGGADRVWHMRTVRSWAWRVRCVALYAVVRAVRSRACCARRGMARAPCEAVHGAHTL